jgi:integrase
MYRYRAQLQATHGSVAVSAFGPEQASAALRPQIERGALIDAARMKAAAQAMWNIGIRGSSRIDLGPDRWLPASTVNPWLRVSVPKPKTEGTYVPRDLGELRRFGRALAALGDAGDVLWLQALTGCRINEVTGARASEVDLEARVWTIPAARMKAKVEHRVMLSAEAWGVVSRRVELATAAGRDHLFPSAAGGDRAMTPTGAQKALLGMREKVNLSEGLTTQAMRRAMATWAAEQGATKDIRDRLLAHVDRASVDARYSLASLDRPAAEWWSKWADFLVGLKAENVVRTHEVSSA